MEMGVGAAEVKPFWVNITYLNLTAFKNHFQGLSKTWGAIFVKKIGNICLMYSKMRSSLHLMSSMISIQIKS